MKPSALFPAAREHAYHLLFMLYGASLVAVRPTLRTLFEVERMIEEDRTRRAALHRLETNRWIETAEHRGKRVLRLTDSGRSAFAGGRDLESAWNKHWDGNWRMLVFDLPRDAARSRVMFWRWLRARRFGRLQGSVWITPHPVAGLAEAASEAGIDPTLLVIFSGKVENGSHPAGIAANAWDFQALDRAYRLYLDFVKRALRTLRARDYQPSAAQITELLRKDRRSWWQAIRHDPLLPKELLPASYSGIRAWEARRELHAALANAIDRTT